MNARERVVLCIVSNIRVVVLVAQGARVPLCRSFLCHSLAILMYKRRSSRRATFVECTLERQWIHEEETWDLAISGLRVIGELEWLHNMLVLVRERDTHSLNCNNVVEPRYIGMYRFWWSEFQRNDS